MDKVNELLEELQADINFDDEINSLVGLRSKVFTTIERENRIDYHPINKSFPELYSIFQNIYSKLTRLNKYNKKSNDINKMKKKLINNIKDELIKLNKIVYIYTLNELTLHRYFKLIDYDKIYYTFFKTITNQDFLDIIKENQKLFNIDDTTIVNEDKIIWNVENEESIEYQLQTLLNELQTIEMNLNKPALKKDEKQKLLNQKKQFIEDLINILKDKNILIQVLESENDIIFIYEHSTSNILKEKLIKYRTNKIIRKNVEALMKLEQYENKKLLFDDKLTKTMKNILSELIEPELKLYEQMNNEFKNYQQNDNYNKLIKKYDIRNNLTYINPFDYPYYLKNEKEYMAFEFINKFISYCTKKINKDNYLLIDFIVTKIVQFLSSYNTIKGGVKKTYIDIITNISSLDEYKKNGYVHKTLIKSLSTFYIRMSKISNNIFSLSYIVQFFNNFNEYSLYDLVFYFTDNIKERKMIEIKKEKIEKKEDNLVVFPMNEKESINKFEQELIKYDGLMKEKNELLEQINIEEQNEIKEDLMKRVNQINKELGIYDNFKKVKKQKSDDEIRKEMILMYTDKLDNLQKQKIRLVQKYKDGYLTKIDYDIQMKKLNEEISMYEDFKTNFDIKKFKKEMNRKIIQEQIIIDYRPSYQEPEDVVIYPMNHKDSTIQKILKKKKIQKILKEENKKRFISRYERLVVIFNNILGNQTLSKVNVNKLIQHRNIFEKIVREISKKLYNYNVMIKSDQSKPFELIYYPIMSRLLLTYFTIHNLLDKYLEYNPISININNKNYDGLIKEVNNNSIKFLDRNTISDKYLKINNLKTIKLKYNEDNMKELREKIKTNKKVCDYIDNIIQNEKQTKRMSDRQILVNNYNDGYFNFIYNVFEKQTQDILNIRRLYKELFRDGEYEVLKEEIINQIFRVIRKEKNIKYTFKLDIDKKLIIKKQKEKDYEQVKRNIIEYQNNIISRLNNLYNNISLMKLTSLRLSKMDEEYKNYIYYSLDDDTLELLKFSLYYQVNERGHSSMEYDNIKQQMMNKYEKQMKEFNITFTDILSNLRVIYETKLRNMKRLTKEYNDLLSETKFNKLSKGIVMRKESELRNVLKQGLKLTEIEIDKMLLRDDFNELVNKLKNEIKEYGDILKEEEDRLNKIGSFYQSINKKTYITSFDPFTSYESKFEILTKIFEKDGSYYKLTNCASIIKQLDINECPYCPYRNKKIENIHLHVIQTHKRDDEKYIEVINEFDPTAKTKKQINVVSMNKKDKRIIKPLLYNRIQYIIDLYENNRHLYLNYLSKQDDPLYKLHYVKRKSLSKIIPEIKEHIIEYRKNNEMDKIMKELEKIALHITKKDLNNYGKDKVKKFNIQLKKEIRETENIDKLIENVFHRSLLIFTQSVPIEKYQKYIRRIKNTIHKNIENSLKYNDKWDDIYLNYNFMQLEDEYKYLSGGFVQNKYSVDRIKEMKEKLKKMGQKGKERIEKRIQKMEEKKLNLDDNSKIKKLVDDIHITNFADDRQTRCYSSAKDLLTMIGLFLISDKKSKIELTKQMVGGTSTEKYTKNQFFNYLMMKYILNTTDDIKNIQQSINESYEKNKTKNYSLPYFREPGFSTITYEENDKEVTKNIYIDDLVKSDETLIDIMDWKDDFDADQKNMLITMIKNYKYLGVSILNYYNKDEIKKYRLCEKYLKKIVFELMSIKHNSIIQLMKNYLDIVQYEMNYVQYNKMTKELLEKYYKEQKFNFVDTLVENEKQQEKAEEFKERVDANKDRVKKMTFDFKIDELDELRIVKEFNELED